MAVFCEAIENDLKKKDTLFSKGNYELKKKDWKSSSFQKEQALLMDTNGDGEIDVDEFKVWFREFFNLNLSTLFVKRASVEVHIKELCNVSSSDKGFAKILLQVHGGVDGKVSQLAQGLFF
jgi:Ca2+-binding EF-hand superfamily protein